MSVVTAGGGSTADIEATFSLHDDSTASFGLAVFCPPHTETIDVLSACTKLTLEVSAASGGTRSATMRAIVPTTPYVNATNASSAVFALPHRTRRYGCES